MKKLFFALLFVFIKTSCLYSQTEKKEPQPSKTKIETVLTSKGTTLIKNYTNFFKFSSKEFKVFELKKLKVSIPKTGQETNGLLVSSYGANKSGSTFIDESEIVGLKEFLKLVSEKIKTTENNQIEYVYNTPGLTVTLYNSNRNPNKILAKEEPGYPYWILNFEVGSTLSSDFRVESFEELGQLIVELEKLSF